jgi:nitrogen fixation/metabolism regulation signal transduction histidine kinase
MFDAEAIKQVLNNLISNALNLPSRAAGYDCFHQT